MSVEKDLDAVSVVRDLRDYVTANVPKFDRVAVRVLSVFDSIPRQYRQDSLLGYPTSGGLLGFPVIVDEEVPLGVIELRKGDEVVERARVETAQSQSKPRFRRFGSRLWVRLLGKWRCLT